MSTTTTNILNCKDLEAFISKLNVDEIKNLLLKKEDLEKEEHNLNNFLEVDEDIYFEEKDILEKKFVELENELDKFIVSAKGGDWKAIICDGYIDIGGEKIFTSHQLLSERYGTEYRPNNDINIENDNTIYKLCFYLLRYKYSRTTIKEILTFHLREVF